VFTAMANAERRRKTRAEARLITRLRTGKLPAPSADRSTAGTSIPYSGNALAHLSDGLMLPVPIAG
jgi:hypothetical protein